MKKEFCKQSVSINRKVSALFCNGGYTAPKPYNTDAPGAFKGLERVPDFFSVLLYPKCPRLVVKESLGRAQVLLQRSRRCFAQPSYYGHRAVRDISGQLDFLSTPTQKKTTWPEPPMSQKPTKLEAEKPLDPEP